MGRSAATAWTSASGPRSGSDMSTVGFVMTSPEVAKELGSVEAAYLLAYIEYRANGEGWAEVSREQIMVETGLSRRRLGSALDLLREREYLETERVSAWDARLRYRRSARQTRSVSIDEHVPCLSDEHVPCMSTVLSEVKNPPTPQGDLVLVSESDVPDPFAEWWALWPLSQLAEAKCRNAYRAAVRKGVKPARLLETLREQVPMIVENAERGYRLKPFTWLDEGRWTLTAPPPKPAGPPSWDAIAAATRRAGE